MYENQNDLNNDSFQSDLKNMLSFVEPELHLIKNIIFTGIEVIDPVIYEQTYGRQLMSYEEMPDFIKQIEGPQSDQLAVHYTETIPLLCGDVWALSSINLVTIGLEEYEYQVKRWRNQMCFNAY